MATPALASVAALVTVCVSALFVVLQESAPELNRFFCTSRLFTSHV
jgi:hypothetical protein